MVWKMQWLWMVKVAYSWVGINPVYMSKSVSTILFHGQNVTGQVRVLSIDRLLWCTETQIKKKNKKNKG